MKQIIKLYTTAGCHLCEQAEAMFQYLWKNDSSIADKYNLIPVDIADDEGLVELFGIRIPVLVKENKELCWPFELQELIEWLNSK